MRRTKARRPPQRASRVSSGVTTPWSIRSTAVLQRSSRTAAGRPPSRLEQPCGLGVAAVWRASPKLDFGDEIGHPAGVARVFGPRADFDLLVEALRPRRRRTAASASARTSGPRCGTVWQNRGAPWTPFPSGCCATRSTERQRPTRGAGSDGRACTEHFDAEPPHGPHDGIARAWSVRRRAGAGRGSCAGGSARAAMTDADGCPLQFVQEAPAAALGITASKRLQHLPGTLRGVGPGEGVELHGFRFVGHCGPGRGLQPGSRRSSACGPHGIWLSCPTSSPHGHAQGMARGGASVAS